ncbi:MAG: hypothetical protein WD850_02905 [Candidatus Spechtbacterales bacterium]
MSDLIHAPDAPQSLVAPLRALRVNGPSGDVALSIQSADGEERLLITRSSQHLGGGRTPVEVWEINGVRMSRGQLLGILSGLGLVLPTKVPTPAT